MVGKPVTILFPADRVDEEAEIMAKLRRGERIEHYETVRVRKDGTQWSISLTVSPVRNAAGEIVGASKIARDITARKQMEETLQQRQTRLDAVIENMTEGLILSDARGNILSMNPAALVIHQFANETELIRKLEQYPDLFELHDLGGKLLPAWQNGRSLVHCAASGSMAMSSTSTGRIRGSPGSAATAVRRCVTPKGMSTSSSSR